MIELDGESHRVRAQSEVVGVVLLVGVVAILILIVGGVVVGNVTNRTSDGPLVDLNVTANATHITLTHRGGDSLAASDVTVVLRRNDTERYSLVSFRELSGNGDAQFQPGEKRQHDHTFSADQLHIFVVDEPTSTVVYDETIAVP